MITLRYTHTARQERADVVHVPNPASRSLNFTYCGLRWKDGATVYPHWWACTDAPATCTRCLKVLDSIASRRSTRGYPL
jgi:hypothetical protein